MFANQAYTGKLFLIETREKISTTYFFAVYGFLQIQLNKQLSFSDLDVVFYEQKNKKKIGVNEYCNVFVKQINLIIKSVKSLSDQGNTMQKSQRYWILNIKSMTVVENGFSEYTISFPAGLRLCRQKFVHVI